MNDHLPDAARLDDDAFVAALAGLGDDLEAAVAQQIATRRNTGDATRHLLHVTDTQEEPMSDHITTPATPANAVTDLAGARAGSRRTRWIVAGATGAVLALGGVAAAAAGVFSTDTVERGMPGGSAIFEGTEPSCTTTDDVVFDCTLAHAPTVEVQLDYTGSAELIVDDTSHISGGCRGVDVEGLHWTCYVGERAVEEQILAEDLLGQLSLGPGHG